jgi:hypothetical protein
VTASQLKSILPPLCAFADADVAAKVFLADPHFDVARWGDLYAEGLANWCCHWLLLDGLPASMDDGAEVSEDVGDTSFSLHSQLVLEQAHDQMMRTRYGQRYRQLADQVGMGGAVA